MRIRTIKPTFFANDDLADLNPLSRLLFIGLWCMADKEGRLEDRPKRIKASVLPYDDVDVDACLNELQASGFVIRYSDDTRGDVLQVVNFGKHQRITGKEAETESDFPAYDAAKHEKRMGKQRGNTGEASGKQRGNTRDDGRKEGREGKEQLREIPECFPRERNLRWEALAALDGWTETSPLTNGAGGRVGKALADIVKVSPDVTPEEIRRRAANYRLVFPEASLTSTALSNNWARCDSSPKPRASEIDWSTKKLSPVL